MKFRTSDEVRDLFLEFFKSKGHMVEPGAPLVPIDDKSLLWINSGVAALKKYFDGRVKPSNPRIVNAQKSLRTNDIDNVGRTARHQTFFEMLGNFSIGDYFKKDAIAFAYEFLFSPDWLGIDGKDAYFSVHTSDQEAFDIWVNDWNIDPARILKTDDNFWQIGDGPCGPNSEIFIDRGPSYDPEGLGEIMFFEDRENDRYVEIWNIVFSQFDGVDGGDIASFKELPQKNIDTGMGFERLVSIVQNGETNFDTDLFLPIIHEVEKLSNVSYKENPMAYRVIADHIRSLVFTLSDGAVFSNEGRGYVLRRILRRAVRYGRVININQSFLSGLVDGVIANMAHFYPELGHNSDRIKELILSEEKRFEKTLIEGEKLLIDSLDHSSTKVLNGETAFKLYDTYGFPVELTQEIALEHGFSVDLEGFEVALEAQRNLARSSRQKSESMGSQQEDLLNFDTPSTFLYNTEECTGTITGLFVDGKRVPSFTGKGQVIVDQTVFYAESGGQVADTGTLNSGRVLDVSKAHGGQHLHLVEIDETLTEGDTVQLVVDHERRTRIRKNHSVVHLVQAALRSILGDHVLQAGSYVDDAYFRFDFSHFEKVSDKDLKTLETMVNQWIAQSIPVVTEEMDVESAKASGAMALFSENYGDVVRVVSMGSASVELCGGTHVSNTSEIGLMKIESEESVGSGVRRIQGKVSLAALAAYQVYEETVMKLRSDLKIPAQKTLTDRIDELVHELDLATKENKKLMGDVIVSQSASYVDEALELPSGLTFVWIEVDALDADAAKLLVESVRNKVDIVFCANKQASSVNFIVGNSEKAIKEGFKAGDLAKNAALATDGNGGGRPNFAQAGGKSLEKLNDAKDVISTIVGIEL